MFRLIKNVEVYDPQYIGKKDILICGNKIVKIENQIEYHDAQIIDKTGFKVIPGLIDQHIHVTGGGGEGGFHTRAPEVKCSSLIKAGITTVVGLLGTDSLTRSVENLVAKTKALKNEGMTAFCLTGAYHYPSPTITGSVEKDITFIEEIIGVKLAISDHREPMITLDELKKLAASVRVAGMVSHKPGIITLHMGDDDRKLKDVFEIINNTSIPIYHFRPTHVNRNEELFKDSLELLKQGGYIDLTVGYGLDELNENLKEIEKRKLAKDHITFSSDGNGSYSSYDEDGKLIKIGLSSCDGIWSAMKYLIQKDYSIEEVIRYGSTNVAHALNLDHKKGYIKGGYDADLLLITDDLKLDTVITLGEIMMKDEILLKKGTFEE